jgi:hypothetical protein
MQDERDDFDAWCAAASLSSVGPTDRHIADHEARGNGSRERGGGAPAPPRPASPTRSARTGGRYAARTGAVPGEFLALQVREHGPRTPHRRFVGFGAFEGVAVSGMSNHSRHSGDGLRDPETCRARSPRPPEPGDGRGGSEGARRLDGMPTAAPPPADQAVVAVKARGRIAAGHGADEHEAQREQAIATAPTASRRAARRCSPDRTRPAPRWAVGSRPMRRGLVRPAVVGVRVDRVERTPHQGGASRERRPWRGTPRQRARDVCLADGRGT